MTDGTPKGLDDHVRQRGRCSGWSELLRRAASHEVAVVAPAGVVVDQPGVDLALELTWAGEPTPVERRSPALLEGGALEALAHGVVVGRARRAAVVDQSLGRHRGCEGPGQVLGPVVGEHGPDDDALAGEATPDVVQVAGRGRPVAHSQHGHGHGPAGGGVDGGCPRP